MSCSTGHAVAIVLTRKLQTDGLTELVAVIKTESKCWTLTSYEDGSLEMLVGPR
jgi:hypothetical protein